MIPGWFITIVTFPGVIVHEIAHRFFCDIARVPVYEAKYFRIGNPAGYVVHKEISGLKENFLISIGPLIVNTLLCMVITFPAVFPLVILEAENISHIFFVMAWIGISIGMHAFPSNHDVNGFLQSLKGANVKGVLYFVSQLFAILIKISNLLRIIWFDAIYAFGIGILLPMWLVS